MRNAENNPDFGKITAKAWRYTASSEAA